MPFYDYICAECGHEFDVLQKISDQPLSVCPQCNKPALSKKVTAPAFRLKGGGWYETDFKTGDKKNIVHDDRPKADKSSDKKTESGSTKNTTESAAKPATKTASSD